MLSESYGQYSRTLLAPVYPVKIIGIVYGKQKRSRCQAYSNSHCVVYYSVLLSVL